MDTLLRRLADPAYARAYREWIGSIVEHAVAASRPAPRHRASRHEGRRGRWNSFHRPARRATAYR
jgi:hypothetical protein